MMTAGLKAHDRGARLPVALLSLFLGLNLARAAAPPPVSPTPPDLATNLPAQTDLAWNISDMELIVNGGLETGNLSGWLQQQIGSGAIFVQQDNSPPEGIFNALIYAVNFPRGAYGIIQEFTIPNNATTATLRWSDLFQNQATDYSNDPDTMQGYQVELRAPDNSLREVLYTTQPGDPLLQNWTKKSVDLRAYRGQTVRVAFIAHGTSEFMILLLDRISLAVDAPDSVLKDVLLDTNPTVGGDDVIGTTTNTVWELPELQPATTYYWRVLTRLDGAQYNGPIWRFTTAPRGTLDHFAWNTLPSPQAPGAPLAVTITAKDARSFTDTNFAGPAQLSAWALQFNSDRSSFLAEEPYTVYSSYKGATVGYAFTPSTNLWVKAFRVFSGDQVSLWTDQGVLLARQTLSSPAANWAEIPLPNPVPLQAARRYRLGVFSKSARTQYARFDGPGTFAHGAIEQAYDGPGQAMPQNPHPVRWWFVDLVYQLPSVQPLPLAPATATEFLDGVWSGSVTLPGSEATNVVLVAQTDSGFLGYGNLINLVPGADTDQDGMPNAWETSYGLDPNDPSDASEDPDRDGHTNLEEYQAGTNPNQASSVLQIASVRIQGADVVLLFPSVSDRTYRLERSPDPAAATWTTVGPTLPGTGATLEITDPGAAQSGSAFYRIFVFPPP